MSDLKAGVRTVVERCLAVREGEEVLVVCDPDRIEIGQALLEAGIAAGIAAGGDTTLTILPPRPARGTEPPATIAAAMAAADVFIAPCTPSLSHTRARIAATASGTRTATMPGSNADMIARLMSADFDAMTRRSRALAELLTDAATAHVSCPLGSDFAFDLAGRTGLADDGSLTAPGAFGNLPCGEGFISPAGGSGSLVVSSIAMIGRVTEPVTITALDGRITGAGGPEGARLYEMLTAHGEEGRTIAELGIGTNENATLTGDVLEDEKILGSIHVAFGASASIGGTVNVPVHLDSVVLDPTLTVGDTIVVDAGRYVL